MNSFFRLRFLSAGDKVAVARGLLALRRERGRRDDLDRVTMADWLREKQQPPRALERFWRPVIVSAANEEPERVAARYGFQLFWLGFLAGRRGHEMGVPAVPLGELYGEESWKRFPLVTVRLRMPVERILIEDGRAAGILAGGERRPADFCIAAVPFERIAGLAPELNLDLARFQHSPITGIHLWFDRAVTDLPFAALLDRTVQWFFNKGGGRTLQLVVSASRDLLRMPRAEVIDMALRELGEFLPAVGNARLVKAHVVKEARATFSALPGLEAVRPGAVTRFANLLLAGDWVCTGWPATMEGAVRGGYLAAEAATASAGAPARFLLPDLA